MKIRTHKGLKVYQLAFKASMEIFKMTKLFAKQTDALHHEKYLKSTYGHYNNHNITLLPGRPFAKSLSRINPSTNLNNRLDPSHNGGLHHTQIFLHKNTCKILLHYLSDHASPQNDHNFASD